MIFRRPPNMFRELTHLCLRIKEASNQELFAPMTSNTVKRRSQLAARLIDLVAARTIELLVQNLAFSASQAFSGWNVSSRRKSIVLHGSCTLIEIVQRIYNLR